MLFEPRTARAKVTLRRRPYQRRGASDTAWPSFLLSSAIAATTSSSFSPRSGLWKIALISSYQLSWRQILSILPSPFNRSSRSRRRKPAAGTPRIEDQAAVVLAVLEAGDLRVGPAEPTTCEGALHAEPFGERDVVGRLDEEGPGEVAPGHVGQRGRGDQTEEVDDAPFGGIAQDADLETSDRAAGRRALAQPAAGLLGRLEPRGPFVAADPAPAGDQDQQAQGEGQEGGEPGGQAGREAWRGPHEAQDGREAVEPGDHARHGVPGEERHAQERIDRDERQSEEREQARRSPRASEERRLSQGRDGEQSGPEASEVARQERRHARPEAPSRRAHDLARGGRALGRERLRPDGAEPPAGEERPRGPRHPSAEEEAPGRAARLSPEERREDQDAESGVRPEPDGEPGEEARSERVAIRGPGRRDESQEGGRRRGSLIDPEERRGDEEGAGEERLRKEAPRAGFGGEEERDAEEGEPGDDRPELGDRHAGRRAEEPEQQRVRRLGDAEDPLARIEHQAATGGEALGVAIGDVEVVRREAGEARTDRGRQSEPGGAGEPEEPAGTPTGWVGFAVGKRRHRAQLSPRAGRPPTLPFLRERAPPGRAAEQIGEIDTDVRRPRGRDAVAAGQSLPGGPRLNQLERARDRQARTVV